MVLCESDLMIMELDWMFIMENPKGVLVGSVAAGQHASITAIIVTSKLLPIMFYSG